MLCFAIGVGACSVKKLKDSEKIIEVKNGGKPFDTVMHLNKEDWRWSMTILENTLNDTAKIGIMIIPPGKTGTLFVIDCRVDSVPFTYRPYKAGQGKLVVQYDSWSY